jgi:uncharacterized protein (TIGR03437 family)
MSTSASKKVPVRNRTRVLAAFCHEPIECKSMSHDASRLLCSLLFSFSLSAQNVTGVSAPGISTFLPSGSGGRVAWSKTNLIAYDRLEANGYFNIHTMNPDGSNDRCLTCNQPALPNRHCGTPDFDYTGQWIIFQAEQAATPTALDYFASPGSGIGNDVWIMDVAGTRFWQITHVDPISGGVLHPHFSHKGDKIQWAEKIAGGNGQWEIQIAHLAWIFGIPTVQSVLTLQPGPMPRFYETHGFSLDDQSFYFMGNPEPQQTDHSFDIYNYNLSTNALTDLTNTPNDWNEHADLSPDGTKILWISSAGAGSTPEALRTDYWIMNTDGSGQRRLTWFNTPGNPEYATTPIAAASNAWSPDGSKFLGYLITDDFGNAGPDVLIDLIAPVTNTSAASFQPMPLAPDAIVSVFSRNMSVAPTSAAKLPLPTTLDGTMVQIQDTTGTVYQAPLFFASAGQVNYAVPHGLTPGPAQVTVLRDAAVVAQGSITASNIMPGIFTANSSGTGVAAAEYQLPGQNAQLVYQCGAAPGSCTSIPIDLSSGNATVILYGTGFEHGQNVTVSIGGQAATVLYHGWQGYYIGLDQLNVTIPPALSGAGEVDVVVTVDGIAANTVRLRFK